MIIKQATWSESKKPIILPFIKDQVDFELLKKITGLTIDPHFEASAKEVQVFYHPNSHQRIYLLGLGEESGLNKANESFRSLAYHYHKTWDAGVQVDCRHLSQAVANEAVLGITLATYQIGAFKTQEKPLEFFNEDYPLDVIGDFDESQLVEAHHTGESMTRIMKLVDAPANQKTPEFLAKWAEESAKQYGYDCEIFRKGRLTKDQFGALLAVGQGSKNKPVLIKMEYKADGLSSENPVLALVGKGITFDTGGLSIKGSHNMHYMKSDMGGAAAVLGAMELVARLKLPIHIVGIVASAENAVDANSLKPGDVITSYSGQTIEIIDTDAEGRLVLADALSYVIRTFEPERIIDLATLTGSCVRTLGNSACGLFTKNQEMSAELSRLGDEIHERAWPLPMYDDFNTDIHSDIADLRNFSGKPVAGATTAAKFLEAFTEEHKAWVHLDIAGVAFGDSEFSKMKSASGYGVRLLLAYMKTLI